MNNGSRAGAGNLRNAVRFGQGIERMRQDGYNVFLELSPHPLLGFSINSVFENNSDEHQVVYSMHRKESEHWSFLKNMGLMHCLGVSINWEKLYPTGNLYSLPNYPWQRQRYWIEESSTAGDTNLRDALFKHIQQFFTNNLEVEAKVSTEQKELSSEKLWMDEYKQLDNPAAQQTFLGTYLRQSLANILHLQESQIELDKPFQIYGLDSILATRWSNQIVKDTNIPVNFARLFRSKTINGLTNMIHQELDLISKPEIHQQSKPEQLPADIEETTLQGLLMQNIEDMSEEQLDELITKLSH